MVDSESPIFSGLGKERRIPHLVVARGYWGCKNPAMGPQEKNCPIQVSQERDGSAVGFGR